MENLILGFCITRQRKMFTFDKEKENERVKNTNKPSTWILDFVTFNNFYSFLFVFIVG